ncbi:hypothetical protein LguiA_017385 [Lonicera macranthoides]
MGCFSSKEIQDSFRVMPDLTSYEAAYRSDPEVRIFDSGLHARTTRAIQPFAASVKLGSFSVDSLGDLTETFLDTHPEVVKSILQSKKEIWKNPELLNLVEIYLENTLKTFDFFTSLKQCLDRARHSQATLQSALDQFEKEDKGLSKSSNRYKLTIQQLKNFEAGGDPFSDEFLLLFESISKQQISTLSKLIDEKSKLDGKLESVKAWRKVSNIIFVATFAAVVIFSVIATAITAPPVVAALAAAAAMVPLGSMGGWLSSIWNKLESEVNGDRAITGEARDHTRVASMELESIRAIVNRIILQMDSLLKTAGFGVREEEGEGEGVKVAIDEMKKKSSEFLISINKLDKRVDKSRRYISWARTVMLKKLEKHQNS